MTVFYDRKGAPELQQLLRSAAHATDCACSVFYGTGGDIMASYGSEAAGPLQAIRSQRFVI